MGPADRLKHALKSRGLSLTAPRQAVFNSLLSQEPLAMHELVARCSSVDRASVYRTVALYEELGIVQRLQTGWKYRVELAEPFHDHHHHITCLICGKSEILPENRAAEKHLHDLASGRGFTLSRHQIELQGVCATCQELMKD